VGDDRLVARDTDAAFEAGESLERALSIVRKLSPSTAEAVMLRVVFDLSVTDVSEIMGRSEGAVRVLVHRGLNRLRELVGDESPGTEGSNYLAEGVTPVESAALT
jgi:RNA polymerase sigma-70 factor (ECF subfamily)